MKELAELWCLVCLIAEVIICKDVIITLYRQSKECFGMWMCASAISIGVYIIMLFLLQWYELAIILASVGLSSTMYREVRNQLKK